MQYLLNSNRLLQSIAFIGFLFLLSQHGFSQDAERIYLSDGRVVVGEYDELNLTIELTEGKIKGKIKVGRDDVIKREPLISAPLPEEVLEKQRKLREEAERRRIEEAVRNQDKIKNSWAERDKKIAEAREAAVREASIRAEANKAAASYAVEGFQFDPATMTAGEMRQEVQRIKAEREKTAEEDRLYRAEEARRAAREEHERVQRAAKAAEAKAAEVRKADDERARQNELHKALQREQEERQRVQEEVKQRAFKGYIFFCFAVLAWLIPIVTAIARRHPHRVPIILLCLIAPAVAMAFAPGSNDLAAAIGGVMGRAIGAIAWIVSLVWSVMPVPKVNKVGPEITQEISGGSTGGRAE
jgi:hypothetical protein